MDKDEVVSLVQRLLEGHQERAFQEMESIHDQLEEFKQSMIEVVELSSREIGEVENRVARVESEIPAAAKGGGQDSVGVEELSRVLRLVEAMDQRIERAEQDLAELREHRSSSAVAADSDKLDEKLQVLESRLASVEMSTLETKLENVTADLKQAAQQSGSNIGTLETMISRTRHLASEGIAGAEQHGAEVESLVALMQDLVGLVNQRLSDNEGAMQATVDRYEEQLEGITRDVRNIHENQDAADAGAGGATAGAGAAAGGDGFNSKGDSASLREELLDLRREVEAGAREHGRALEEVRASAKGVGDKLAGQMTGELMQIRGSIKQLEDAAKTGGGVEGGGLAGAVHDLAVVTGELMQVKGSIKQLEDAVDAVRGGADGGGGNADVELLAARVSEIDSRGGDSGLSERLEALEDELKKTADAGGQRGAERGWQGSIATLSERVLDLEMRHEAEVKEGNGGVDSGEARRLSDDVARLDGAIKDIGARIGGGGREGEGEDDFKEGLARLERGVAEDVSRIEEFIRGLEARVIAGEGIGEEVGRLAGDVARLEGAVKGLEGGGGEKVAAHSADGGGDAERLAGDVSRLEGVVKVLEAKLDVQLEALEGMSFASDDRWSEVKEEVARLSEEVRGGLDHRRLEVDVKVLGEAVESLKGEGRERGEELAALGAKLDEMKSNGAQVAGRGAAGGGAPEVRSKELEVSVEALSKRVDEVIRRIDEVMGLVAELDGRGGKLEQMVESRVAGDRKVEDGMAQVKAQLEGLAGRVRSIEGYTPREEDAAERDSGREESGGHREGGGASAEIDLRPVWERLEAVWEAVDGGRGETVNLRADLERVGRLCKESGVVRGDVERLSAKVDGYFGVWTEESEGTARQVRDLWAELSSRRAAEVSAAERVGRELGLTPIRKAPASGASPIVASRIGGGGSSAMSRSAGVRGSRPPRDHW